MSSDGTKLQDPHNSFTKTSLPVAVSMMVSAFWTGIFANLRMLQVRGSA